MSSRDDAPSRVRLLALVLGALLTLALAGCAGSAATPTPTVTPTVTSTASATSEPVNAQVGAAITLAPASFTASVATLRAGQALRFDDPAGTGGPHMLCLGQNQICAANAVGPVALHSPGFRINAGDPARLVVFATPGVYQITCTLHPLMNLTVTVR